LAGEQQERQASAALSIPLFTSSRVLFPSSNMPLHSIQHLSPTAVLGLWHLTETPDALWAALTHAAAYQSLLPATADARRQAQWLAGRQLAHALFGEMPTPLPPETRVQNDATGRPWLLGAPAGTVVSLSHSGEWVAAVLAQGGRAGVDVELVRDKAQRLAKKFLADNEWAHARAATAQADADTHYTLLWSAKEALYKLAAQRGIIFREQLLLHEFSPQTSGEIPATLVLNEDQTRHRICYTQPAPGYVLTYCHEPAG
jgi:4'-phosphopantetheinyl transferase